MKIILTVITLIILSKGFAQETEFGGAKEELKRNVIYGTGGTVIVAVYGGVSYERMLFNIEERFCNSIWLNAGFGAFNCCWESWEATYNLRGSYLTGLGKNHLEITLGSSAIFDKRGYSLSVSNASYFGKPVPSKLENTHFHPAGSIGYRLQKPGGNFIFRTGFGFPESLYISLGVSF